MNLEDEDVDLFRYARDAITHIKFSHDSQYLATAVSKCSQSLLSFSFTLSCPFSCQNLSSSFMSSRLSPWSLVVYCPPLPFPLNFHRRPTWPLTLPSSFHPVLSQLLVNQNTGLMLTGRRVHNYAVQTTAWRKCTTVGLHWSIPGPLQIHQRRLLRERPWHKQTTPPHTWKRSHHGMRASLHDEKTTLWNYYSY